MSIVGKKNMGAIQNEADVVNASLLKDDYENYEFSPVAPLVDEPLTIIDPLAFGSIARAHTVIIRSDQNITFKFNSTLKPAISLSATEGVFTSNTLEVTNIFFNAPAGANIKVFMV